MKLIIFGASGASGRHLVEQALEAGHQVTALVRTPQHSCYSRSGLVVSKGMSAIHSVEAAVAECLPPGATHVAH